MVNTLRIYKSKQAEALDDRFRGSGERLRAIYNAALREYKRLGTKPLSELVSELASQPDIPWSEDTAAIFANSWPSAGPGRDDADIILRQGYQAAFELALEHDPPVPLETFWVTGAGDDFEIHVSDGDEHVTVFMVVPGVAGEHGVPAGSKRARNKSWVITAGDRPTDHGRHKHGLVKKVVKIEVSGAGRDAES